MIKKLLRVIDGRMDGWMDVGTCELPRGTNIPSHPISNLIIYLCSLVISITRLKDLVVVYVHQRPHAAIHTKLSYYTNYQQKMRKFWRRKAGEWGAPSTSLPNPYT